MIKKEDVRGTRIGDVINKDTVVLTEFMAGFVLENEILDAYYEYLHHDKFTVIATEAYVLCFVDEQAVALFSVYELCHCSFNKKRGVVKAEGHETIHEYWFDDGEYREDNTR